MADTTLDETIKTDETKDLLGKSVLQRNLARAEELKKITPNWKMKLAGTLVAIALPVFGLALDAGTTYLDYQAGQVSEKQDLPEMTYEQKGFNDPHSYALVGEAFPPVTHKLSLQEGQTPDDIFKIELSRSLFPELKVNIDSLSNPSIVSKIDEGIAKYRQNDESFYSDLQGKFLNGIQKLNPEINVIPGQPITPATTITSLSTSPVIAELQLSRLLANKI